MFRLRSQDVQAQQRPALGDALVNDFEEPGISVSIGEGLAALGPGRVAYEHRGLLRLLGSFPGVPGLAFEQVELLELDGPGLVEVSDGRFTPLATDRVQVVPNRGLSDAELLADG